MSTTDHALPLAEPARQSWGLLAEYLTVPELLAAAEKVRNAGYRRWDCHTPFPVHGLNDAMGLKPTILPWLVLGAGITGGSIGMGLQWFTNAFDYPFIIGGKPFFSVPACIPVAFELTILFAAVTALLGMLVLNNLPEWYHALFRSKQFRRATADRFFISIEAIDPLYSPEATREFLKLTGSSHVELIEEEAD
ncbi:MAG: hypothetical protein HJJLKODD_01878 [Phycisphaerae bacterium]|nr:hypothetical protein [Phycisphaerae bacterium]